VLISKFTDWDYRKYLESEHPEYVAIRNIITRNACHQFVLLGEGTRLENFKVDGISFYNLPQQTKASYFLSFILKMELALVFRPSVFVSMGTTNLIPYGICSALIRSRFVPVITGEIRYGIKEVPGPLRFVFRSLLKFILKNSHDVLALSKSIGQELIRDYSIRPDKIRYYTYKISPIFGPNISDNFRSIFNPNGPIVLTISRISREKGLEYLIKASKIVVGKIPSAKIIIKGSSPLPSPSERRYEAELRKLVNTCKLDQNIVFLKTSKYSEIPRYMASADVFVLPSVSEGLGLVILEALASGVPVVASRVGGIAETLTDGYNGLLVEPRDVEGLAENILRLLDDTRLRKQIIQGGLETANRGRTNEIEELLEKLLFQIPLEKGIPD
jgi:glycosyltransferase involved in cell wall biosynthesis